MSVSLSSVVSMSLFLSLCVFVWILLVRLSNFVPFVSCAVVGVLWCASGQIGPLADSGIIRDHLGYMNSIPY